MATTATDNRARTQQMNHPGEAGESEGNPLIAVEEGRGGDAAGGAAGPAAAAPARSSGSQFVGCAACTMLLGVLAVLVFDSPALLWMGAAGDGSVTWVTVALYTLPMALTAGLGGLPFFFVKDVSASFEGAANAMASGVMLAVSFDLLDEILCTPAAGALPAGQVGAAFKAVLGLAAGALFIRWSQVLPPIPPAPLPPRPPRAPCTSAPHGQRCTGSPWCSSHAADSGSVRDCRTI